MVLHAPSQREWRVDPGQIMPCAESLESPRFGSRCAAPRCVARSGLRRDIYPLARWLVPILRSAARVVSTSERWKGFAETENFCATSRILEGPRPAISLKMSVILNDAILNFPPVNKATRDSTRFIMIYRAQLDPWWNMIILKRLRIEKRYDLTLWRTTNTVQWSFTTRLEWYVDWINKKGK